MTNPLVTASDVRALLADGDRALVLLDVRWRMGETDGHEQYLSGHLPTALFVDLDADLASAPEPQRGRHPLPAVDAFAATVALWGITPESTVVVYDDWMSMAASRAWWLLDAAGHADVRVLDGGIRAWTAEGFELERGEATREPVDPWVSGFGTRILDADAAWSLATGEGTMLDARAAERYDGSTEPIDPKAGHVPGALSAPTTGNVDERGLFLPPELLRERFAELGVTPGSAVGTYCGSGVTAAHEILALRTVGIDASLYAGSWSQWSNLDDRPVAIGPTA
jgi:thiosulfate/3-mercaptopyruvate sulfurtransferase